MMISVATSALLVFKYINRPRPDGIKKCEIEPMNSTYIIPEDESDDDKEIFNQIKCHRIAEKDAVDYCKSEDGKFSI